MMCAVEDCPNHYEGDNDVRTYAFPKNLKLQEQWVLFCRRNPDTKVEGICEEHFTSDDFEQNLASLVPEAVPRVYHVINEEHLIEEEYLSEEEEGDYEMAKTNKLQQEISTAERKQIVNALLAECEEKQVDTDSNYSYDDGKPVECVKVVVDADAYLKVLENENSELKRQNFKMKLTAEDNVKEMGKLQSKLDKAENKYNQLIGHLQNVFSKAQIDKLQNGRRIVWPEEDMVDACTLYAASGKVYDILLNKNYPLPSKRTLQNWDARQREQLIQDNDPDADCTIHHWRCAHRTAKAAHRKDVRKQEQQKQRDDQHKEQDLSVVMPNLDHNYVHI